MQALLVVDIQKDFLPGGALAVPEGDAIIPLANKLAKHFSLVVASQDWHPRDHTSFADNHEGHEEGETIEVDGIEQILWPVHCVQNQEGAEFADDLNTQAFDKVIQKGMDPKYDSYSAFFDNGHKVDTGLNDYLKEQGVETVYICGLAADVCVKFTALDAVKCGYDCRLIQDATRGVNLKEGDVEKAMEEMCDAGVRIITSEDVLHAGTRS
ncbi:MAG: bifunctional nicotinamidase/pyrazinamidase [Candidatus Sumerlaeia bacterium]